MLIKKSFNKYVTIYVGFLIIILFSIINSFKLLGKDKDFDNYFKDWYFEYFSGEPFYNFLILLTKNLSNDYRIFLFTSCLISLLIKYYAFSKFTKNSILCLLAYLFSIFWLHEYTQIRAAFSIGFSMLAVYHLKYNKMKMVITFSALSILSHYSGIINVIFLLATKIKLKYLIIYFLSILIVSFLVLDLAIFERIVNLNVSLLNLYQDNHGPIEKFNFINFSIISVSILLLLSINEKFSDSDLLILKAILFSTFLYLFFSNLGLMTMAFRFLEYYLPFSIILIIRFIIQTKNKLKWSLVLTGFTLINFYKILNSILL